MNESVLQLLNIIDKNKEFMFLIPIYIGFLLTFLFSKNFRRSLLSYVEVFLNSGRGGEGDVVQFV